MSFCTGCFCETIFGHVSHGSLSANGKTTAGFHPSTFVYSSFSPKIQLLYYLLSSISLWGALIAAKGKVLKIRSPDCWKVHFPHTFWLQKHSLYIVDKHDFLCEYYGLVINVHEIALHKLVPVVQDIREMKYTCALSIIMIRTIMEDQYYQCYYLIVCTVLLIFFMLF